MGTRSLTCVFLDGEYKVAQYGQWDGYPEGQGMTCLEFLQQMNREKFVEKLRALKFAPVGYVEGIYDAFGAEDGMISISDADKILKQFPQFHRDTAADILKMIEGGSICKYLKNSFDFAADSLFCEWAYVIDLDSNTFEVYKGFNKEPLAESDRFCSLEAKNKKDWRETQYHPVKLFVEWSLDDLPSKEDFLEYFNEEEEE